MEYITFKDFCKSNNITAINKTVNVNSNGYPFITVLRGKLAENVYFSKNASTQVNKGDAVKDIASQLFVAETANADGEVRMKLTFNNSSYESIDDMF